MGQSGIIHIPLHGFFCDQNILRSCHTGFLRLFLQIIYGLLTQVKKLLLAIRLIAVLPSVSSDCHNDLICQQHQLLDNVVLYRGKARKPIKGNDTVCHDAGLGQYMTQTVQCLFCCDIFLSDILQKSFIEQMQVL